MSFEWIALEFEWIRISLKRGCPGWTLPSHKQDGPLSKSDPPADLRSRLRSGVPELPTTHLIAGRS